MKNAIKLKIKRIKLKIKIKGDYKGAACHVKNLSFITGVNKQI